MVILQVDGAAIGFMSLTTEVDIDLLNDCFELGTFHGLRKSHEGDVLKKEVVEETEQGGWSKGLSLCMVGGPRG